MHCVTMNTGFQLTRGYVRREQTYDTNDARITSGADVVGTRLQPTTIARVSQIALFRFAQAEHASSRSAFFECATATNDVLLE